MARYDKHETRATETPCYCSPPHLLLTEEFSARTSVAKQFLLRALTAVKCYGEKDNWFPFDELGEQLQKKLLDLLPLSPRDEKTGFMRDQPEFHRLDVLEVPSPNALNLEVKFPAQLVPTMAYKRFLTKEVLDSKPPAFDFRRMFLEESKSPELLVVETVDENSSSSSDKKKANVDTSK